VVERIDYRAGDGIVPVIPYDVFEAANLFLATGRTTQEVLPRIGVHPIEWERLRETYRWFPYRHGESQRRSYFADLDDSGILQLVLPPRWSLKPGDEPNLRTTWHIREAVRRNPHIGPFAGCGWAATCIAPHPEATLCCYTHDGRTVYFDGRPIVDRKGHACEVDAESFEPVGGRWFRDKHRIYGQGEFGPKPTSYWYVVEGAHRQTFKALNLRYARDDERAYYITGKVIRTKSPDAFEIVPTLRLNYRDGTRDFLHDISVTARDREAVYFYGMQLKGAQAEHFRELGHGYATDGETVWFLDNKKAIEGADAATFTVPGPGEPYVRSRQGRAGVTDRLRPYIDGEPCDPEECFENWRPFFAAMPDTKGWWWHRLAGDGR
jgi:DKNYY family